MGAPDGARRPGRRRRRGWALPLASLLLAAAGAAGGGVRQHELPCRGQLPAEACTCDWLAWAEQGPGRDPLLVARKLRSRMHLENSFVGRGLPFWREDRLHMVGDTITFLQGGLMADIAEAVSQVRLPGLERTNFLPPAQQFLTTEKFWPMGNFLNRQHLAYSYLRDGLAETKMVFNFDVWSLARHITVENAKSGAGAKVAWVELSVAGGFANDNIVFTSGGLKDFRRVPPTQHFVRHQFGCAAQGPCETARFQPSVSNAYVTFGEFFPSSGRVAGMLFHSESGAIMTLGGASTTAMHLRARSFGADLAQTAVFWVSSNDTSPSAVRFNHATGRLLHEQGGLATDSVDFNLLLLPAWSHITLAVPVPDAVVAAVGAASAALASGLGFLVNFELTETRLFLQLCSSPAHEASSTVCAIVSCGVEELCASFRTLVVVERGKGKLSLQAGDGNSLVYWVGDALHFVQDVARGLEPRVLTDRCRLQAGLINGSLAVTVYKDTVVTIDEEGTARIFDLDKDNDGVLDVEDLLPTDGLEWSDDDNDGVGNGADAVDLSGSACADDPNPGACVGDTLILGAVFGFVAALIFALIYVFASSYHSKVLTLAILIEDEVLHRAKEGYAAESTLLAGGSPVAGAASAGAQAHAGAASAGDGAAGGAAGGAGGGAGGTEATAAAAPGTTGSPAEQGSNKESLNGAADDCAVLEPTMHQQFNREGRSAVHAVCNQKQALADLEPVVGEVARADLDSRHGTSDPRDLSTRVLALIPEAERAELYAMASLIVSTPEDYDTYLVSFCMRCERIVRGVVAANSKSPLMVLGVCFAQPALDLLAILSAWTVYSTVTVSGQARYSEHAKVVIGWLDMYVSAVFAADLAVRCQFRSGALLQFFWKNAVDLLSLITPLPGPAWYMTDLYRLNMYLHLVVAFRCCRVYQRLFQETAFVSRVVMQPTRFIMFFLLCLLSLLANFITQAETEYDPNGLGQLPKSMWFTVVTVSTVGYGDYAPVSYGGRFIAMVIMTTMIGLVGAVSNSFASALQTVGSVENKVKQVKAQNRARYLQWKEVLDRCAVAYNPVLSSVTFIFIGNATGQAPHAEGAAGAGAEAGAGAGAGAGPAVDERSFAAASRLLAKKDEERVRKGVAASVSAPPATPAKTSSLGGSSSASAGPPGARSNAFPVAMPIAITIGTNKGWLKDSALGVAASKLDARRTRDVNRRFVKFVSSRGGGLAPRTRLTMLLESFGLENHEGISNFAAFVGVVTQAVFAPPLQNDLILERVFAMHEDLEAGEVASKWAGAAAGLMRKEGKHENTRGVVGNTVGVTQTEVNKYSLLDPLDRKLAAVEEVLRSPKWQLLRRVDFDQLVLELTMLVLEFERVETAQWALLNLRTRPDQRMPKASLLSAAKVEKVKRVIATLPDDMKQCTVPEFLGLGQRQQRALSLKQLTAAVLKDEQLTAAVLKDDARAPVQFGGVANRMRLAIAKAKLAVENHGYHEQAAEAGAGGGAASKPAQPSTPLAGNAAPGPAGPRGKAAGGGDFMNLVKAAKLNDKLKKDGLLRSSIKVAPLPEAGGAKSHKPSALSATDPDQGAPAAEGAPRNLGGEAESVLAKVVKPLRRLSQSATPTTSMPTDTAAAAAAAADSRHESRDRLPPGSHAGGYHDALQPGEDGHHGLPVASHGVRRSSLVVLGDAAVASLLDTISLEASKAGSKPDSAGRNNNRAGESGGAPAMQLGAFAFGPARSIFGGGNTRFGSGGFAADFEMGQLLQANALEDKEEEEW